MSQRIAILGYGIEGRSAYRYYTQQWPDAEVTIFDERKIADLPQGAHFGGGDFSNLFGYDIVVRTPIIRPDRIKTDGAVTSVIKEFFKVCPTKNIVGITGSKGKGTTVALLYTMLKGAGMRVHMGGNIGVAALDLLPDIQQEDIVVLELSSFQLWDLDRSPHIAVVLMVEPEHLDVHKDINEYLTAKTNLVSHQRSDDLTIYLPNNPYVEQIIAKSTGQKMPYTKAPGAEVIDGAIVIEDQRICGIDELALVGEHNQENACAAVTAAWQYTHNVAALAEALRRFAGLDHRLKLVTTVDGVRYYDDSIATTPGSAIAAIKAFSQSKIVILGGLDKGADFGELADVIAGDTVKEAILIGTTRLKLQSVLARAGFTNVALFNEKTTMNTIVAHAHQRSAPGDVVILSPACTSFDMFKDYKDRGEQFAATVLALRR